MGNSRSRSISKSNPIEIEDSNSTTVVGATITKTECVTAEISKSKEICTQSAPSETVEFPMNDALPTNRDRLGRKNSTKTNLLMEDTVVDSMINEIVEDIDDTDDDEEEGEEIIEDWLLEETIDEDVDDKELEEDDEEEEPLSPYLGENKPLYDIMKQVQLFCSLSQNQQEQVLRALKPAHFGDGECIVKQGEKGTRFYMIAKGEAVVTKRVEIKPATKIEENKVEPIYEERMITHLHAGHYFGELALIYDDPRTATVRAVGDVELMYLTQEDFHKAGKVHLSLILKQVPLLATLHPRDQDAVLSRLQPANFSDGEFIVRQGEEGDRFYIITRGEAVVTERKERADSSSSTSSSCYSPTSSNRRPSLCRLSRLKGLENERELTRLYEGHVFGEMSLIYDEPRTASVVADGAVKCLYLTKEDFQKSLMTDRFHHLIQRTYIEKATARALRKKVRKQSQKLRSSSHSLANTEGSASSLISVSSTPCISKSQEARETTTLIKHRLANGEKVVNKYVIKGDLGRGTYGRVKLCHNEEDGQMYAVKILPKTFVQRLANCEDYIQNVLRHEVAIMKKLHHPNVVRLHEVIDDPSSQKMYLVQEYVEKGNLVEVMKEMKDDEHKEDKIRKYVHDILRGLQYLHFHHVVHRDIKPENLLVTADDNVKLADFGAARRVMNHTETLTEAKGTPAFMAPELFNVDAMYTGPAADIWSLGATLFMMSVGVPPWNAENEILLSQKIQYDELVFPEGTRTLSPHLRNLIRCMLTKDPSQRITLEEVMRHEWITREGSEPLQLHEYKDEDAVTVSIDESEEAIRNIPEQIDIRLQESLAQAHCLIKNRKTSLPVPRTSSSSSSLPSVQEKNKKPTSAFISIFPPPPPTSSNLSSRSPSKPSSPISPSMPPPFSSESHQMEKTNSLESMDIREGQRVISAWRHHKRIALVDEHTQLSQRSKDLLVEQKRIAFSAERADVTELFLPADESDLKRHEDFNSKSLSPSSSSSPSAVSSSPPFATPQSISSPDFSIEEDQDLKNEQRLKLEESQLTKRTLSRKKDFLMVTSEVFRDESGDVQKRKVLFQARDQDFSIVSKIPMSLDSSHFNREKKTSSNQLKGLKKSFSNSSNSCSPDHPKFKSRLSNTMSFHEEETNSNCSSENNFDSISTRKMSRNYSSPVSSASPPKVQSIPVEKEQERTRHIEKLNEDGELNEMINTHVNEELESSSDDEKEKEEKKDCKINLRIQIKKKEKTLETSEELSEEWDNSSSSSLEEEDSDAYSEVDALDDLDETFEDLIRTPRYVRNELEEDEELRPLYRGFESSINEEIVQVSSTKSKENEVLGIRIGTAEAIGKRTYMEDRTQCILAYPMDDQQKESYESIAFMGIYDGHNGFETSETLQSRLHEKILDSPLVWKEKNVKEAITKGCQAMDTEIVQKDQNSMQRHSRDPAMTDTRHRSSQLNSTSTFSGSTAVVALVVKEPSKPYPTLYIGNIGDCRAVLCRGEEALEITTDHKASLAEEKKRIELAGGFVHNGRLNGVLAVSRSFGDTMHKVGEQLIAVPDVFEENLDVDDEFLLLGCDGLFDVLTSQQAVNFIRRKIRIHGDLQLVAQELVAKAQAHYSHDNISVLIVYFHQGKDDLE